MRDERRGGRERLMRVSTGNGGLIWEHGRGVGERRGDIRAEHHAEDSYAKVEVVPF